MTALGSDKIWILVPDWVRLKSSEPKAGDVTRKIGPLYFIYIWKSWIGAKRISKMSIVLKVGGGCYSYRFKLYKWLYVVAKTVVATLSWQNL